MYPWAKRFLLRTIEDSKTFCKIKRQGRFSRIGLVGTGGHFQLRQIVAKTFWFYWQHGKISDPTKEIEFLGFEVNSLNLSVALPNEKGDSIFQLCSQALLVSNVSVRDIATILGLFACAANAVPFAQAHYRDLQSWYIIQARGGDMGKLTCLSDSCRRSLTWWLEVKEVRVNGKPLKQKNPLDHLFLLFSFRITRYCKGVKTWLPWLPSDRSIHINELELTVFHCLRAIANHTTDLCIILHLDNATAVAYINKRGGSRSPHLIR